MSRYAAFPPVSDFTIDFILTGSELPKDREQRDLFLAELSITHFLSVSPSQTTSIGLSSVKHHHLNITNTFQEALLLALPEACDFIRKALTGHGQVLVHCRAEMRACIIVAAYGAYDNFPHKLLGTTDALCLVMSSQKITSLKASSILEDGEHDVIVIDL
jgi:hypothetical protein